ncbi:MAG: apolipoprotein N-acyltransferase [Actinomycetota bacterium]|nr:apolipoprotein N-acyltransferase [Actinomycetota bacterium]
MGCSLAFPPAGIWPIAFVAMMPFLWVLRGATPQRRALLGFGFGLAFFGATLYWILLFGELAWSALIVMSASFTAAFALLSSAVVRPRRPVMSAFGLAALWTVMESLRDLIPFGGFSWGTLGVTQVDNRVLLRLASITGVWGVSFVLVAVNALLVEALAGGGAGRVRAGRVLLAVALTVAPIAIAFPTATGGAIDVAAIQVDVHTARGLPPAEEDVAVARLNIRAHETLAADPPDLAVWGESAVDPGATTPKVFDQVRAVVAEVGTPTLMGSIQPGPGGLQNQVLALDGRGEIVGRYAKSHLVPFGEYVPFRGQLSWIGALRQIPYDLVPGTDVAPLRLPGLPPVGTPICFENAFPGIERELVLRGAGFLTVLTNNASYEQTALSRQHVELSRMRAVEDGRWVVHAAVSGISAFVDPSGAVVAEAGLFQPAILRHTIRSSDTRTWYVRLGDWVPRLSALFVLGLFMTPPRRRGGRSMPGPLPQEPRTLVILPTYDERETVEWVLERLMALPEHVDVLVVDDSSPDGTAELVRALSRATPRIRVRVRPVKAGLASAYLEGFGVAIDDGYDLIVEMDSDLSHQPEELPGLLIAAREHDLVIGSRYVPGGSVTNWSASRVALSKAGNRYARLMLGLPVRDVTSGFRVYRPDLLMELVREPIRSDGYGFQIELVDRSWRLGFDVAEAPITFREREHGQSKISRRIVVEALVLVAIWGIKERLGGRPALGAQRP